MIFEHLCGIASGAQDPGLPEALARMATRLPGSCRPEYPVGMRAALGVTGPRVIVARTATLTAAVAGQPFLTGSASGIDVAAAILDAYRDAGERILERLRGPFAIAILDAQSGSALLAIDRTGIHSLCWCVYDATLVFASSPGPVIAHPRVPSQIDSQALFDYLYFHCVPAPRTIFSGVSKLLPGQCLVFSGGKATLRHYWSPVYHDGAADFRALREEFRGLLPAAVRRAAGALEAGCFLSGGTDSTTVAGVLSGERERPPRTYSIGFGAPGYDEMSYARLAARHFGTEAREYYVTPEDVVRALPLIAAHYEEPFGNASAVPTYYCARLAADDGVSLMLAGDGGDELFAGNTRYAKQSVLELYTALPAALRAVALDPLAAYTGPLASLPFLRKFRSYIEQARVPLPDRLETYNLLHHFGTAQVFAPDFLEQIRDDEPLQLLREVYHRAPTDSCLNRMLFLDLKFTLADNDLRKVTRMCHLAGVHVRYPLLDDDIVELAGRVPPQLKMRHLKLRYFFKKALGDFLPVEILSKTKHGFGLPFGVWLRDHAGLQELTNDTLATFRRRSIVEPAFLDALARHHQTGDASYYGVFMWIMISLELWLQAHEGDLT